MRSAPQARDEVEGKVPVCERASHYAGVRWIVGQ